MKLHVIGAWIFSAIAPLPAFALPQAADTPPPESVAPPATERVVNPPKVVCRGNTLSISATNSRLGAILTEIQKCTGVQFDAPEDAKSFLIFDEIGPGPSNNVLTTLLTSSGFNYVIGASPADPEKIEQVVLLNRTNEKDTVSGASKNSAPLRKAFAEMREAARPKTPEMQAAAVVDLETAAVDSSPPSQPAVAATEPISSTAHPDAANATAEGTAANADAPPSQPAAETASPARPVSPVEEGIANLQKLFEQRRQMMQTPQASSQTQAPSSAPQ